MSIQLPLRALLFLVGLGAVLFGSLSPIEVQAQDLEPTYSVQGSILDKATGKGIAGANVQLIAVRGPTEAPELIDATLSGEEGEFTFEGLDPPNQLRFESLGYRLVVDAPNRPVFAGYVFTDPNGRPLKIAVDPKQATLRGRVLDSAGNPVVGATVYRAYNRATCAVGLLCDTTDEEGLFEIERMPIVVGPDPKSNSIQITVDSDLAGRKDFQINDIPGFAELRMPTGCLVRGSIVDQEGNAMANTLVSLRATDHSTTRVVNTDKDGSFAVVVPECNYHIMVEDPNFVASGLKDIECAAGKPVQLEPFVVSEGGWITGQVVHPTTGKPVVRIEQGERVRIGLRGPSRPMGQETLVMVDDDGRFRLRAAAGENFPYTLNLHTDRMLWTREAKPIMVAEGETIDCVITQEVRKTGDEKMAEARKVFARLPADKEARIKAIIEHFRALNNTVDETELWCLMMRDLVEIGSPAVPALCDELERTNKQRMLRRLGFALRAINDPRSVPALIRAIPKGLQPSMSDYGLIVENQDLAAFMQQHELGKSRGNYFDFGRPVRELFGALQSITGKKFDEQDLFSISRSKDRRLHRMQQERYQGNAETWAKWWEANWSDFDVDKAYAKVNLKPLPEIDPSTFPTGLDLGESPQIDRHISGMVVCPIGDKPGKYKDFFLDLDTGRSPAWPKSIEWKQAAGDIESVESWASREGCDLICVKRDAQEGESPYVLRGIGLKLWEIDSLDARNLDKRIAAGQLPKGDSVDDMMLMARNANTGNSEVKRGSSFLYLTKEDSLGVITITDIVTIARDITGYGSAPQGVGFHKGIRFDLKTIAR